MKSFSKFTCLTTMLLCFCFVGCTEQQETVGAPEASTNEINAYLEANPDAKERPEDFAEGDEDEASANDE